MLDLESLSKDELIRRLKLAMDVATAVDGMWFLEAETVNGYDKALEMDINVWKRYPKVLKKRMSNYYEFKREGLAAVKEFMENDPMLVPIDFELISDNAYSLVFKVHKCPALEAMERTVGQRKVRTDLPATMGSEDFGWMLAACPGAYGVLGNGTSGAHGSALHHPGYDFNDAIIPTGVRYWVNLTRQLLPDDTRHASDRALPAPS